MIVGLKALVRFAIPAPSSPAAFAAFDDVKDSILREGGPALEPLFVPTYAALYETVAAGEAEAAWAPPLVARDFVRAEVAVPLVVATRNEQISYYSALVVPVSSPIVYLGDLAQSRIGWVSKLSAAGYVVPRWFLQSAGYDVETLFSLEKVIGSHAGLGEALARSEIDVAATYASARGEAFLTADLGLPLRILGTAGPIPGDVIVARCDLEPSTREALGRALVRGRFDGQSLRTLMNADRFAPAPENHLASLSEWEERAERGSVRSLAVPVGTGRPR